MGLKQTRVLLGGGQSNVGSLMLRDSDCVCDGEYGNSDNVSLLQVVKVL